MKKELLRIQDFKMPTAPLDLFQYFSFNLFAGEITCILAPSWSGKTVLAKVLSGVLPFEGQAFFQEAPVRGTFKKLAADGAISLLSKEAGLFGELSIAENIFLGCSHRNRPALVRKGALLKKSVEILSALDLSINPSQKAAALTNFEQHMVLLSCALCQQPKLIVLDDPTYYYSQQERKRLASVLGRLQTEDISVLYLSSSVDDIILAADKVIVMNDNRKVRTFYRSEHYNRYDLLRFFQKPDALPASYPQPDEAPSTVLTAHGLHCGPLMRIGFSLKKWEILGIYDPNNHNGDLLCRALAGDIPLEAGTLTLDGRKLSGSSIRRKIYYLPSDFAYHDIFDDLTIFENILIFRRFSAFRITPGVKRFIRDSIEEQLSIPEEQQNALAGVQDVYTRIKIVLYRFLLIKPQVLVFNMPFSNIDYTARQTIKDFFHLYKNMGICILYTSAQWEDLLDAADRVLLLENGTLKMP